MRKIVAMAVICLTAAGAGGGVMTVAFSQALSARAANTAVKIIERVIKMPLWS